MAQTITNLLVHAIFSTKDRRPLLKPDIKPRLFSYVGGGVRNLGGKAYIINGAADHVHMLVSMPPTMSIAEIMRGVKANSSAWVHEEFVDQPTFAW
jgi:putative transposase